ncbi:hypothetical protein OZX57_06500 [Bifidobacterium sp. ESL0682]|uniref:hypothetical protein n=1 Tax=Bifidobacterium sp. ESL0682 TaxID=2983212 RepID=UPI0023F632C2|nr:hypothetical protein [Bifidobacterium sp. ESL0682]WEV41636.1 hypothetical protein OZX57_06500 [Bifidobacterium sp. ESL0682]
MDELDEFYVHRAVVRTSEGVNGDGEDIYTESDAVPCFINDQSKLIRDQQGQQVVGSTTVICSNQYAPLFRQDSEVLQVTADGTKVSRGRVALVDVADSGPLGLPDHTTVNLV